MRSDVVIMPRNSPLSVATIRRLKPRCSIMVAASSIDVCVHGGREPSQHTTLSERRQTIETTRGGLAGASHLRLHADGVGRHRVADGHRVNLLQTPRVLHVALGARALAGPQQAARTGQLVQQVGTRDDANQHAILHHRSTSDPFVEQAPRSLVEGLIGRPASRTLKT
eukprot:7376174-Prymnesium_polylepis.2